MRSGRLNRRRGGDRGNRLALSGRRRHDAEHQAGERRSAAGIGGGGRETHGGDGRELGARFEYLGFHADRRSGSPIERDVDPEPDREGTGRKAERG